jgi:hypothetical protein
MLFSLTRSGVGSGGETTGWPAELEQFAQFVGRHDDRQPGQTPSSDWHAVGKDELLALVAAVYDQNMGVDQLEEWARPVVAVLRRIVNLSKPAKVGPENPTRDRSAAGPAGPAAARSPEPPRSRETAL